MNGLQVFNNIEFGSIRTVEIDGKIYFVGIDIAKSLGYSNASKAVIQHCKGITKLGIPSNGGIQETNCIPEGDLYRLITHSELPSAEQFEVWVFDGVLPAICKHGMYAVDELLENPDLLIKVATELKEERKKRKIVEEEKEHLQQELDYSKDWYSIKRVAAMNGVSWKTFDWRRLKESSLKLGFQIKKSLMRTMEKSTPITGTYGNMRTPNLKSRRKTI